MTWGYVTTDTTSGVSYEQQQQQQQQQQARNAYTV